MSTYKKKPDFFVSEAGAKAREALIKMVSDETYSTEKSYSANTAEYPDNVISFVDKHMAYLRSHPQTDPEQYLSNLRLITRRRAQ